MNKTEKFTQIIKELNTLKGTTHIATGKRIEDIRVLRRDTRGLLGIKIKDKNEIKMIFAIILDDPFDVVMRYYLDEHVTRKYHKSLSTLEVFLDMLQDLDTLLCHRFNVNKEIKNSALLFSD